MGVQSVFTNIGAMCLTYVGGWAAAVHWHLNYLVYLYALIPAVLGIIFLPNDKPHPRSVQPRVRTRSLSNLSRRTLGSGAITFLFMILYGVHSANISFFVVERNLGSPTLIGTIMAVCTLGGMLGGSTFGFVNKILKTYILCCICAACDRSFITILPIVSPLLSSVPCSSDAPSAGIFRNPCSPSQMKMLSPLPHGMLCCSHRRSARHLCVFPCHDEPYRALRQHCCFPLLFHCRCVPYNGYCHFYPAQSDKGGQVIFTAL